MMHCNTLTLMDACMDNAKARMVLDLPAVFATQGLVR